MSETDAPELVIDPRAGEEAAEPEKPRKRSLPLRILRWLGIFLLGVVALMLAAVAYLHTSPGRQLIVEQIAKFAPASGLTVRVGRIEGSVLWSATLHGAQFYDANDTLFLEVPEIDLDWRPFSFFFSGLDLRYLVLHEGTLLAAPELNPGDPNAPTLPNFDIRVDHFVVDDLRIARGVIGEERIIDFRASANVTDGLVYIDAAGQLGGGDRFTALVHAEPDGNVFDLELDYVAPQGGLLAELTGAREDLRIHAAGDGTWQEWTGALVVNQGGARLAALKLYETAGRYKIVGQVATDGYVSGLPADALGSVVSVAAVGTLQNSVLAGGVSVRGEGVSADVRGWVDLANNRVRQVRVEARLLDPDLFGPNVELEDARLEAVLDGAFRNLTIPHELYVARADLGGTILVDVVQKGVAVYTGSRLALPINAAVQRIVTGNELADPRLVNGRITGLLVYTGDRLVSEGLAIAFPGLRANLALDGDLSRGLYQLSGPVDVRGFPVENVGVVDLNGRIAFRIGSDTPWALRANVAGRLTQVTNATLANLAGENIRFRGKVALGAGQPIVLDNVELTGSKLQLQLDAQVVDGEVRITGRGRHVEYGAFTVEAEMAEDGPRAVLVFENPLPAAGLRDVRVALSPSGDGFRIEAEGQSMLGPFSGLFNLYAPEGGPTRVSIERLEVSDTLVTGDITLVDDGVAGTLRLVGGGVDGTVELIPRPGGQGFDARLVADNARFGGATPLTIRSGTAELTGVIGTNTVVEGTVRAEGVEYGSLYISRLAATGEYRNGRGTFDGSLIGRRGETPFRLQLTGTATPDRIAAAIRGTYAGRPISMPRRAVLLRTEDGGWELQKTQVSFAGGYLIAEGRFGGDAPASGRVALAEVPLSVVDIFAGDLGLGGTASGVIEFQTGPNGLPTGEARLLVEGLSRSGLTLSSRPIDLALVADLSPDVLQARALMTDESGTRGRFQGRIANLPATGSLMERLQAGSLFAQLRYDGPTDALWRLAAVDILDITGNIDVAADIRGSLQNPQVSGSLAGDDLRVVSSLTGTSLRDVDARGRFSGSRLQLTRFSGVAPNGGTVTGSGTVDLSNLGAGRGPQLDIRAAAVNAEILDRPGMEATVTGPLRIVSTGIGGTIAGRLRIDKAYWQLGGAVAAEDLPSIRTREINMPEDLSPPTAPGAPWRFLINASANDDIEVDGMGLDSEWSAEIRLRGTTDDPRIGGGAEVIPRQGFYSFAGTRFDITRGRIAFDESVPIDPRIDILAETQVNDLAVAVSVTGSALQPDIEFSSTPSLPEEEILARLLFGGSISNLSATDALQLGAALASLRGGGGLDPINKLREAIGLDRLRLVPADPALDRETAVALGKNFGRRLYAEIITDGRGYNATSVEYRITGWLSLLATVSSIGRESVAAAYRKDY
ncbi:translocation/assembly module TamB domain-containing protein [Altericroceibacterium xinjiangense]|uniref:translocation/assembly module TamB domain-containing protein n=1 Tax=Altericroceibacterium xinjiangense TaxID=762261 RepID=UPI000F7F3FA5|nr:translocation/assembly module TamB domain-containing protein [Altericroceibacterium xinjiangense]